MIYFGTIFSFLLNIDFFFSTDIYVFFYAEEMTNVSDEIYIKEEASCSSFESDQVCSVFFMTLLIIIDIIFIIDIPIA